jgi:propanediol dehydratase large subunit
MHEWQLVRRDYRHGGLVEVRKLRLPGGWIYETVIINQDGAVVSSSTVYVHGVNNG